MNNDLIYLREEQEPSAAIYAFKYVSNLSHSYVFVVLTLSHKIALIYIKQSVYQSNHICLQLGTGSLSQANLPSIIQAIFNLEFCTSY